MFRQPFYTVREEAYLYPGITVREGDQEQHEEKVRQWCAYELIRTYGIRIDEIEFERQVKIGSKRYRIDILVTRNGRPWVVVECKRRNVNKPVEGIAQAISYADEKSVQAPFAVYTNGDIWHTQRKVADQWLPVPDLPARTDLRTGEPLTEILRALKEVGPILHKLDENLEQLEAKKFLSSMQSFFVGGNIFTDGIDQDLLSATDHLLRVLSCADHHPGYLFGKLERAHAEFESYRKTAALSGLVVPPVATAPVAENLQYLSSSLSRMIDGADGTGGLDHHLLRLNIALAEYGMGQIEKRKKLFPQLSSSIHRALTEFLNASMSIHMNTQLPDHLDRIGIGDVKNYCQPAWEAMDKL